MGEEEKIVKEPFFRVAESVLESSYVAIVAYLVKLIQKAVSLVSWTKGLKTINQKLMEK